MNIPSALLDSLTGIPGYDREQFIAAHDTPSVTSVRMHPVKGKGADITGSNVPWALSGRYLQHRPVFTLDPAFHAGAYYVQEASSMFLEHVYNSLPASAAPRRVLDLCAAPGGKSTLLASLLRPQDLLISNEVIRTRASILEENVLRWGYMNNWVTCNDPRNFTSLSGYFDVIVVDAPCSGSGLFRKDAAALNEWSEANVTLCAARQQRIIADIWPALKQHGTLIYATCSFSPAEDELLLDELAEQHGAETIRIPLHDSWGITEVRSAKHGCYGYRFFPHKLQGEGFFIAALTKTGTGDTLRPAKYKTINTSAIARQAGHLLATNDIQYLQPGTDSWHAVSSAHEADWHLLHKSLYFRRVGIELGTPTAKDWIPAHDVALSVNASASLTGAELTREQALKFLKREDFPLDGMEKGWNIMRYNGLGLGWMKVLPNRGNNHLPKNWRIRMDIDNRDEQ